MRKFVHAILVPLLSLTTHLAAIEVTFGPMEFIEPSHSAAAQSLSPEQVRELHQHISKRAADAKANRDQSLIAQAPSTFAPAAGLDGLPAEKNGIFPVQMPVYNGVEQILVLNNKWVIVAITNLDEVSKQLDVLAKADPAFSSFDFAAAQKKWAEGWQAKKMDWVMKKAQIDTVVKKYFGQARVDIQEPLLENPAYYRITSTNDNNYKTYKNPSYVTRFMCSLGAEFATGYQPYLAGFDICYGLYSYVEMPTAMVDGKTYTITLMNGKAVTFTYDELTLVSRAIKVNQVGYLPDAKKYAYVGGWLQERGPLELPENTSYSVVDANSGQPVFSGTVKLRNANPRFAVKGTEAASSRPLVSGENIYEMDISSITNPGTYFVTVKGVGRSWPFTVDKNALSEAFYTAFRGMYHQRCGIAIGEPHSPWPRVRCHYQPVFECSYIPIFFDPLLREGTWLDFDMVGGTMNKNISTADATGGWHDAGDWDKRIQHYACIFDLLSLYELKPNNFTYGQLNIPEAGNNIPDVLSEAEYGLLVWKKSMRDDGGVAGRLETSTHPSIDDPAYPYAYSLRTRWSSLMFATAAAQYAHLVRPFSDAKYNEWLGLAKSAYAFGTNAKNSLGTITIKPKTDRGKGTEYNVTWTEVEHFNKPFLIAAKIRLTIATNDKSYVSDLDKLLGEMDVPYSFKNQNIRLKPGTWPFTNRDGSLFLYSGIFHPTITALLPAATVDFWKKWYVSLADPLVALNDKEYYRRSRQLFDDTRMAWGTDVMTNDAKVLLYAYHLTNDPKYKQAALYNIDYMLGGNPTSMSWTTGIGYVYPIPIHHRVSTEDGIRDPVPGIAIYGPTESHLNNFSNMWSPKDPAGKPIPLLRPEQYVNGSVVLPRLRNWVGHPVINVDMNEFTIWETNSSGFFVYGYLLDEDWTPPDFIKNRKPRDPRVLFGQWYLP